MSDRWPIGDDGRAFPPRLVSSLYRLMKSEGGAVSKERGEERLTQTMQRLVTQLGREEVVRRIRAATVRKDMKLYQGWLVLTAEACRDPRDRQRAGTFR